MLTLIQPCHGSSEEYLLLCEAQLLESGMLFKLTEWKKIVLGVALAVLIFCEGDRVANGK